MSGPTKASSNFTLRFHFERTGRLRFTSHLDMLRAFQRAFMRGKISIAFSQGFNPHPEFVIGMPLGVGTTSDAEYADLGMNIEMPTDQFVATLNANLPEGLRVLSAEYKHNKDNIMGKVDELRCLIKFEDAIPMKRIGDALSSLLSKSEVNVEKTTKKGKSVVEIRSKIREAQVLADSLIALRCDAGSHSTLSPDLFVGALWAEMGEAREPAYFTVHRTAILVEKDGRLVSPMEQAALN
ncbi:MAG: TIGR03936 family radical SAM-associated protein [Bacillota bacterium]